MGWTRQFPGPSLTGKGIAASAQNSAVLNPPRPITREGRSTHHLRFPFEWARRSRCASAAVRSTSCGPDSLAVTFSYRINGIAEGQTGTSEGEAFRNRFDRQARGRSANCLQHLQHREPDISPQMLQREREGAPCPNHRRRRGASGRAIGFPRSGRFRPLRRRRRTSCWRPVRRARRDGEDRPSGL